MIIALIGNDGSGKTTTSKELATKFREIGFETIYKHEYDYVFLKYLLKLTGGKRVEESRKQMLDENQKGVKFLVWPALVWLDTLAQYIYFKLFKRNSIVILDRYPYDHYMSFDYLGYLTKFTRWLYLHFPKADATILLWVEPEVAYTRKKETHSYALSFYEGQTKKYLSLAGILGLSDVNTNRAINSSVCDIFDILYLKNAFREAISRRALENKTYPDVLVYKIGGKFSNIMIGVFEERKTQFKLTVGYLRDLFGTLEIKDYAIFKDYGSTRWVGNDIDVIIGKADFVKLSDFLQERGDRVLDRDIAWRRSKSHSLSLDIKPHGLLNLDVHTAIGWRGLEVVSFDALKGQIITKEKFGIEYKCVPGQIDAFIYACSHALEKGFVVSLEYQILQQELFRAAEIPKQADFLAPFLDYASKIDQNMNYPVFIPIRVSIDIFSRLGRCSIRGVSKKAVRILGLQLFWRLRYMLVKKLPFDVAEYKTDLNRSSESAHF